MRNFLTSTAVLLLSASAMTSANAEIIGKNYAQINARTGAGWEVNSYFDGNRFHSCGASTIDIDAGMDEMQLEFNGSGWLIGRNEITSSHYTGQIFVGTIKGDLNFEQGQSYWTVAYLENVVVAELRKADSVIIEAQNGNRFNYSLSGSTAAMSKVEECVRNQGHKRTTQRRQTQPRVAQQPTPRRQTNIQPQPRRQNNVQQKAVLSGTWQWADAAKNNRDRNIVSTIELIGSGRVRYCYGFPCWDVDARQDGSSYTFSIDGVSMFQFWDRGSNTIEGRYWGNFGTNNPPDATVNMN